MLKMKCRMKKVEVAFLIQRDQTTKIFQKKMLYMDNTYAKSRKFTKYGVFIVLFASLFVILQSRKNDVLSHSNKLYIDNTIRGFENSAKEEIYSHVSTSRNKRDVEFAIFISSIEAKKSQNNPEIDYSIAVNSVYSLENPTTENCHQNLKIIKSAYGLLLGIEKYHPEWKKELIESRMIQVYFKLKKTHEICR
jgi:hypothetical protein